MHFFILEIYQLALKLVAQLKPGETITSKISISEEAAVEDLRGKTVTLEIELLDFCQWVG